MKRILVIEDAHALRRDILEMLSFEGYDVVGAEDGVAGVERARELLPDLILCDIMMPGLDGYEVLQELRQDAETATIPFIFLTARSDRLDIRHGMQLGADDYLTKPFTAGELLASVGTRLEKRTVIDQMVGRRLDDLRENIILALPHELRTPLNVILGFSDLLMTDFDVMEPPRVGDMARHINNAAMRLYRLVENFLIYANIQLLTTAPEQVERLRQRSTPMPRAILLDVTLQKAQQHAGETRLDLAVDDTASVQIAEDYLRKIMDELVDNAFKFSEESGRVTVRAAVDRDCYRITVTDQGRGMTVEQIQCVGAYMQFDRRFYEQQGSGLGLTIAKRLVELHGGDFDIASKLEAGTTVTLTLPLVAEPVRQ